ncbi:hypothetical protein L2E82_21616 [Cichorium intybus]|uniref:Uncharacterized protein n=1 Tax=Cichorium intybus TaxID=13427 RepID=A0ACB9DWK2_CICIN|nr:hypothetical protein L2E82_21616 [Cichorium intybus]
MAEPGVEKKKRVVIIGGGVGGSLLCKTLQKHRDFDFTLIDPKEYFEITWARLRSMVEPSFAKRSVINHHEYLQGASIITSDANGIEDAEVSTTEGRLISYDYLVIATGHMGSKCVTRTEKLREYEADNEKIKSSESILIIGGGPTGVELAGEIAVDFPTKKVKLVHKGSRLLEFIDEKASKKVLDWLTIKKVEVILGQSVDLTSRSDDNTYKTSDGETIMADCHFKCTSDPIASSWLKDSILKDSLTDSGRLMVDANLRVKGFDNIFAIGDITDIAELKQGYLAQKHALVVAKNLVVLINGGNEGNMVKYTPASPMAIVSLGRKEAVAQISCVTMIGRIPGMLKSKDLFVGKTRKLLGLKA